MPDAVVVQIADAITAALATEAASASSSFSFAAFYPRREYLPDLDRADLDDLSVIVVPISDTSQLQTRNATVHTYTLLIDVRKPIRPQHPEDVDALTKLVEEICDFLRKNKMATANWVSAAADPLYDPEELHQSHKFVSRIEAVYTLQRGI